MNTLNQPLQPPLADARYDLKSLELPGGTPGGSLNARSLATPTTLNFPVPQPDFASTLAQIISALSELVQKLLVIIPAENSKPLLKSSEIDPSDTKSMTPKTISDTEAGQVINNDKTVQSGNENSSVENTKEQTWFEKAVTFFEKAKSYWTQGKKVWDAVKDNGKDLWTGVSTVIQRAGSWLSGLFSS